MNAQTTDITYSKQWKEINNLINKKNLPKSALAKVKNLYVKAKKDNNASQIVKTLLYQISLNEKVDDNSESVDIVFLTKELGNTKNETVQSLLNLMLANAYNNAYNNDRWTYEQRKETTGYQSNNYKTWTKKDFSTKIYNLLQQSFSNKKQLQQTTLNDVDAIVLKGKEPQLRPTLYDLMAFDAIIISENFIENESYSSEKIFDAFSSFMKEDFSTISENKHFTNIISIFQDVLKFHAKDKQQDALIDADINRIEWMNNHFANVNETVFSNAIQQIINYGKTNTAADEAYFILANHHFIKGKEYDFKKDTSNRYEIAVAKKIIDDRLKEQPKKSSGNIHLQNLNKEILAGALSAIVENVNVPNEPFRMRVAFKNTENLYYKIIDAKKLSEEEQNEDNYWKKLRKLKPIKEFAQTLPPSNDYQHHSTEIKIDALPIGDYLIFGSNTKEFNDSTSHVFSVYFTVSNLSAINAGKDYFVLHRNTGQPIANATIQIIERLYERKKKPTETIVKTYTTDKKGFAKIDFQSLSNSSYFKKVIFEKDVLNLGSEYYYTYQRNNQYESDEEKYQANIFMDRSIYRPGQTVYFKALLTNYNYSNQTYKIHTPKKKLTVILKDANYKDIDSLELAANEFGSINGSFKLQVNSLTGNFSLQVKDINSSTKYFSVEEYKRPTFYIEVDKIKESIRLNDEVKLKGFVKAYAGNASNNATVQYTITRAKQIHWWRYERYRSNEGKTIEIGKIKTNDDGSFEIIFKAKEDATQKPKKDDEYNFSVNITVTDINGETREKTEEFTLSHKALKIESNIAEKIETKKFKNFTVATQNMFGEKQSANVAVKVFALQTPTRAIRKRLWDETDLHSMKEAEFITNFPYDEYKNETDFTTWRKSNIVFETNINTEKQDTVTLQNQLPQGFYAIELITKDRFGEEVKETKYTELYSIAANSFSKPQFNWSEIIEQQKPFAPKDTATILIGSSFNNVFVIQNLQTKREVYNTNNNFSFMQLSNEKKAWNFVLAEENKGGFAMNYAFVKHNRFYTGGNNFSMPFLEKELQVELASFRNKTEPNSKETWSIKIKGLNNTKAEAELLTAMYDASLNQFREHSWNILNYWRSNYNFGNNWNEGTNFATSNSRENYLNDNDYLGDIDKYSSLAKDGNVLWWLNPLDFAYENIGNKNNDGNSNMMMKAKTVYAWKTEEKAVALSYNVNGSIAMKSQFSALEKDSIAFDTNDKPNPKSSTPNIAPRKNLQETAFFFPTIYADKEGNYTFSFTMPEALTQWRWLNFAHTKDLATGYNEATIVTQKTLMVQPNIPRFLREGDQLELITKVANLSNKELTGQCTLELLDATTGESVDGLFTNNFAAQYFTVAAQKNVVVKFPIQVPFNFNKPISIRIIAKTSPVGGGFEGAFSDGEENTIPVLTNRTLVTETLPLYLKSNEQQKTFTFNKLLNNKSETLHNQALTVEYTANPIWNVVKSLPYLMEYPYECAEQTFNRLFANALATNIVNNHPQIKNVFEIWMKDSSSKLSSLQQNEELKQALLQETPWVLDAENEAQQQKNIALLFDVVKMSKSQYSAIDKLIKKQLSNGAFPWFKGGNANTFITNYIVTGIGKLIKLGAIENNDGIALITQNAINYLDEEFKDEYNNLKKSKADLQKNHLSSSAIEYLYMKSFFVNSNKNFDAYNYYHNQAKKYWNKQNSYYSALIGFVLMRSNDEVFVQKNILPSILENTVEDTILGTIKWKQQQTCFWFNSPFEHQATMIEFLHEAIAGTKNESVTQQIDAAKTWLILNKQTNNWQTTIATAEACYALLSTGTNWLNNKNAVSIKLGNTTLQSNLLEPGTGYFKQKIDGDNIQQQMGNVQVKIIESGSSSIKQNSPSYGAVYWQYFEDLDKITITDSTEPLHLIKKIFKEKNTATGKILEIVNENDELKVGDKLVVRIELSSNRSMEYLHLKDMRASGSEPVNVLSGYKWQNNLGYYESTKDASSNFFIDRINKGTYVFEYPVFITHTGTFSVGIATIQCMYTPEFTSHSEGLKIRVTE